MELLIISFMLWGIISSIFSYFFGLCLGETIGEENEKNRRNKRKCRKK